MTVSAVGSAPYVPGQFRSVGLKGLSEEDEVGGILAASAVPAPFEDGDADDRGALSTPLTRSSPPVQDALLGLQTGK
jgi:hypothetical protein